MNITPHILKGSGKLTPFINEITQEFNKAMIDIKNKLPVSDIDIIIYDNPQGAIPEIGIGGYTQNANLVFISLDSDFPGFESTIKKELRRTLAHEIHHAIRWRNLGYGESLLEALISEGLADHFDIEINNSAPELWSIALDDKQLKLFQSKAEKEYNNKKYDHALWFFGSEDKHFPKWVGYSLGYKLIADYLQKNPVKKPSALYKTKAKEFIQ